MDDDETFEVTCEHCGETFTSDLEIWEDYDQLDDRYNKLMLIFNPGGFEPPWFCSRKCHQEAIEYVAQAVREQHGETCSRCNRKAGTWRMKPCNVCEKIVCDACEIDDGRNGRFCSKECQQTVKHCAKCNMLIPINGPTHCEWCEKRNNG